MFLPHKQKIDEAKSGAVWTRRAWFAFVACSVFLFALFYLLKMTGGLVAVVSLLGGATVGLYVKGYYQASDMLLTVLLPLISAVIIIYLIF